MKGERDRKEKNEQWPVARHPDGWEKRVNEALRFSSRNLKIPTSYLVDISTLLSLCICCRGCYCCFSGLLLALSCC